MVNKMKPIHNVLKNGSVLIIVLSLSELNTLNFIAKIKKIIIITHLAFYPYSIVISLYDFTNAYVMLCKIQTSWMRSRYCCFNAHCTAAVRVTILSHDHHEH